MKLELTRRSLMAGAAAGSALLSARLAALPLDGPVSLVIVQPGLFSPTMAAIADRHAGVTMLELDRDVVRQWRDMLGDRVASAGQAVAYIPWAQTQILAGLMREAGGTSQIADFAPQLFEVSLALTPAERRT